MLKLNGLVRAAAALAPVVTLSLASSNAFAATVPFPVSAGGTGNGYEVILNGSLDQAAASSAASSAGGHLVSITSASEQSFIEQLLSNAAAPTGSYWMGLERTGPGSGAGSFAWETNEPVSFTHFASGEPNNYPSNENFGTIYWSQDPSSLTFDRRGGWNDAPAGGFASNALPDDLIKRGYILEVEGAGGGNGNNGGGDGGGNGGGNGGNGGGDGGGGNAIPLPPALLAAPLGMLLAGWASRRRKV